MHLDTSRTRGSSDSFESAVLSARENAASHATSPPFTLDSRPLTIRAREAKKYNVSATPEGKIKRRTTNNIAKKNE